MFSIIIPVHNSQKTLNRCLDSVLLQSYSDFEVLLIENGSNDESFSICKHYEELDKRFKTYDIGKCNGPSKPRNFALGIAKGEYICFLDSDDWVESDYLERYIAALVNNDVAFCSYVVEDDKGNVIREAHPKVTSNNNREQSIELISSNCFGLTWCKAFKKAMYKDLRFNENTDLFEDSIFTTQLMAAKPALSTIDRILYHYVIDNTQSITRIVHKDMIQKKDMQFSAWKTFFGDEYKEFIVEFANECVTFCKNYIFDHDFNLRKSYNSIQFTEFYSTALINPNKDTAMLEKGFILFTLEYRIRILKSLLYRRFKNR